MRNKQTDDILLTDSGLAPRRESMLEGYIFAFSLPFQNDVLERSLHLANKEAKSSQNKNPEAVSKQDCE
jgi:hypothetical protein